jgi:hypothetical protein
MSFDLAIWEGTPPGTAAAASETFQRLYGKHVEGDAPEEPSPAIRAFVAAITAEYPDLTDLAADKVDDGVWADGPLIGNASGPFCYIGIVWSRAESVAPVVARIAAERKLVCFDPQEGRCMHGRSSRR